MPTEFDTALLYVVANEGVTAVAAPNDTGIISKFGITLATLSAWRMAQPHGISAVAMDVQNLTLAEAGQIYRALYWAKLSGDALTDWSVATVLMDAAVLTGVAWAAKGAQTIAAGLGTTGLLIDGNIGAKSVAAINGCDRRAFITAFAARQQAYFVDIVVRNPTQRGFLKGWAKRVAYYSDLIFV